MPILNTNRYLLLWNNLKYPYYNVRDMFIENFNPTLLAVGPFEIRWYGLFYIVGFILAYFMLRKLTSLKLELIEDLLVYAGVYGIIGARIFYVLVYNAAFYFSNPLEMLAVWHGGLSFHGGLLGALLGIYFFAKKHKQKYLYILDRMAIPFAFAVGIGRIGNFINGELYGRITNVPWCIVFPGVAGCRHPSQLYESLYSFIIFGILWYLRNRKLKEGTMFGIFVLLYSAFRFITEFFRQPDAQLGFLVLGLTMGQILCIIMFIVGILFIFSINKHKKKH